MDPVISDLINRYDSGRLSRRDLVAGLSALAAVGSAAPALAQAPAALTPKGIDHVSILVADLERSKAFYRSVFGLVSVSEDVPNKIVRLAPEDAPRAPGGGVGPVMVSLRQSEPYGTTDHWCFKLPDFNTERVTQTLKGHGLTPDRNVEYGFYVKDPDGIVVQMF